MNFLSLFTGIGGMDLGLERAGLTCMGQVEINPWCRERLAQRWPSVPRFADVTKFCRRIGDCEPEDEEGNVRCPRCGIGFDECECIGTDEFTDTHGTPDLIVGGDPCQENSNARNGRETTSPSLGGEFIRIVDELRPRLVLRENPSVVRRDAPWPWHRFRSELERLGYAVVPFRLRACCVGSDHRRERLCLLAQLQDAQCTRLEGHECEVLAGTHRWRQDAHVAGPDRRRPTPRLRGSTDGVPDWAHRLKAIGNAVDVSTAEFIGRAILTATTGVLK